MPSPTSNPEEQVTVRHLMVWSDEELRSFMEKQSMSSRVNLALGWGALPRDVLQTISQRVQSFAIPYSPVDSVPPPNLDYVVDRLQNVANGTNTFSAARFDTFPRVTDSPPDWEALARESEIEAYHGLRDDGGRPCYPIDQLEDVAYDPYWHQDKFYPWKYRRTAGYWDVCWDAGKGQKKWELFQKQLARWQDFRMWQRDNRGLEDDDETKKGIYYTRNRMLRQAREDKRRSCKEKDCDSLADYAGAVQRRLARHAFARPFQLLPEPKQQDRLSTWVEYLSFEYWWLDRYNEQLEATQTDSDNIWQELVSQQVLKPHETWEKIDSYKRKGQFTREVDDARVAVEKAKEEVEEAEAKAQADAGGPHDPQATGPSTTEAAAAALKEAEDHLGSVARRADLFEHFAKQSYHCQNLKSDIDRQTALIQWALDQVPLVEAEMAQAPTSPAGSGSQQKRSSPADEEPPAQPSPKKQKLGHAPSGSPSGSPSGDGSAAPDGAAGSHAASPSPVVGRDTAGPSPPPPPSPPSASSPPAPPAPQPPRRSSRVAARRNAPPAAATPAPQGLRRSARIAARQNALAAAPPAPPAPQPRPRTRRANQPSGAAGGSGAAAKKTRKKKSAKGR